MGNNINPKNIINYNLELGGLGKVIKGHYPKETEDAPKTQDLGANLVDNYLAKLPDDVAKTEENREINFIRRENSFYINQLKSDDPRRISYNNTAKERLAGFLSYATHKAFEAMGTPEAIIALKFSDLTPNVLNYLGDLHEITSKMYSNGTVAGKWEKLNEGLADGEKPVYNELTDNKNRQLLEKMELLAGAEEGGNDPKFADTIKQMRTTLNTYFGGEITDNQRINNFADGVKEVVDTILTAVVSHQDQLGFSLSDPQLNDGAKKALQTAKEEYDRKQQDIMMRKAIENM